MKLLLKTAQLCFLLLFVNLSHAQSLNGVWANEKDEGIVSLVVSGEKQVRAIAKCSPKNCDWGLASLKRVRTISGQTITNATFNDRTAKRTLSITKVSSNRLKVKVRYDYHNQRPDKNFTYYFKKSDRVRTINSNPSTSSNMVRENYYEVTINYIKCIDPNDAGGDEAEFLFLRDDEPTRRLNKFLDVDDRLNLGGTYAFKDFFTIKFYDNDSGSRDDYLGQWQLKNPRIGRGGDYINAQDSRYFISYSVVKKTRMVQRNPRNVTIELIDLICDRTEDDAGKDEPFVAGGMIMGDETSKVVTKPMSLNDNQNRAFTIPERIVYNGPIPRNADRITIGLTVWEEDAKASWLRNEQNYQRLARNIGRSIDELTEEPGTDSDLAEAITETTAGVLGELIKMDEDDLLKDLAFDFDLSNLNIDDKVFHWSWAGHGGSRYTVRFRITGRR
ncbi:MAG: hypothetical protein AAF705_06485 [Bacteroidota bacterium]